MARATRRRSSSQAAIRSRDRRRTSSDDDQQRLLFVRGQAPQSEDPIQNRPVTGNGTCAEVGQQQHRSNSELAVSSKAAAGNRT